MLDSYDFKSYFLDSLVQMRRIQLNHRLFLHHTSGEQMYPTANNIGYGGEGKVSKEGVDRMVADLEKQ